MYFEIGRKDEGIGEWSKCWRNMVSMHMHVWAFKFDGLKSPSSCGGREEQLVAFRLSTQSLS
jgi:hypothetical protein